MKTCILFFKQIITLKMYAKNKYILLYCIHVLYTKNSGIKDGIEI